MGRREFFQEHASGGKVNSGDSRERERRTAWLSDDAKQEAGSCWVEKGAADSRLSDGGTLAEHGSAILASDVETSRDGNTSLALTPTVVHVQPVENPMKSSGISSTELIIAVVALGLLVVMFAWVVDLRRLIQ